MGTRTSHDPGTFSWADLQTSDQEAAKGFYGELFGWEFEDMPAGPGTTYSMASVDGSVAAAIAPLQAEDPGPPRWNNYVTVEDAAATAAKAGEAGGSVMMDAFDVFEAGRMAVIADPTGAVFCVWEPKQRIGAEVVNEIGALTWNELATPDPAAAASFYTEVFGWGNDEMDTGDEPSYTVIQVGDRANGGIREQSEEEKAQAPAYWVPYFAVESVDATVARAGELGGSAMMEPIDVPMGGGGRIAALHDPQGAMFCLWQGEMDD